MSGSKIAEFLITLVLKDIENSLPCQDFFRTHKSYLINLNHIIHYQTNQQTEGVVAREEEMKSGQSGLKGVLEPGLSSEEIGPDAPTLFDELDADRETGGFRGSGR